MISFASQRPRLLAAVVTFGFVSVAALVPAMAAESDPSVNAKMAGDDLIVVDVQHFPSKAEVALTASIDGGRGEAELTTTANGRAVAAFELPEGFAGGPVTLTAIADAVKDSFTLQVPGGAAAGATDDHVIAAEEDSDDANQSNGSGTGGIAVNSSGQDEEGRGSATLDPNGSTTGKSNNGVDRNLLSGATGSATATGVWLSGGAGTVGGGDSFGSSRGAASESASNWADGDCTQQGALTGEYGGWNKPLVVAIGGLTGQSWSEAANGGVDGYWRSCLEAMKAGWGDRDPGLLYISLFHESNGTWYKWSVRDGDFANFQTAFHRFRVLQKEIMPEAKLMLAVNADNLSSTPIADFHPKPEDYDVYGIDYYSMHFPNIKLENFPAIAAAQGKPIILQEWGWKAKDADRAKGMAEYVYGWLQDNAGTGPGKVIMDNYFNIGEYSINSVPSEQAAYNRLWKKS